MIPLKLAARSFIPIFEKDYLKLFIFHQGNDDIFLYDLYSSRPKS